MALGTSIKIFLADGAPDGLRLIEKSNWTGLGLVVPRAIYPDARTRPEFERTGVYVLRGETESDPPRPRIYIGETDRVRQRVDRHLKEKEWWDELIVFISKDQNLNKAHVGYLEARLNALASTAKRVGLVKGQDPSEPKLSEADRADAEGFLQNMLLIYPLLGLDAFEKPPAKTDHTQTNAPLLALSGKGSEATGRDLPEGFVVYQGSTVRRDEVSSIHDYLTTLREQLLADGVIEDHQGQLRFAQDFTFASPSRAAGVLLGRTANGRIEWIDRDSGRTLKDLQEAALDSEDDNES